MDSHRGCHRCQPSGRRIFPSLLPKFPLLFLSPLAFMLLSACGSSGTAGSDSHPKDDLPQEAIIANVADVVTLDPLDIADAPSGLIASQVMEPLVMRDADGRFIPGLATDWEVSEDGLTWTFHLRQGVRFHDGSPFDSESVVWHVDRLLLDADAPTRFRANWSATVESVSAPDAYTVVFHLKEPNAAFLDLIILGGGGSIPSPKNFQGRGPKDAALHPVGTGPFIFEEWVPGQKTVLRRNPDYWGVAPRLETLIFRPIPESTTQVIELETGGVHLATKLGAEDLARLKTKPNIRVEMVPAYQVRFFMLNVKEPPLDDVRVRKALILALDRPTVVETLVGDMGVLSGSAVLPLLSWGHPHDLSQPAYDPQKAAELLDEAGWVMGPKGVREKDGQPLTLNVISSNGRYFADKEISEVAKKEWQNLGINVKFSVMEWAPYLDDVFQHRFHVAFLGWNVSGTDPALSFNHLVKSDGWANFGGVGDPELDGWLEDAQRTHDEALRQELYRKAAFKVADEAWFIPLYNENKLAATRKEFKGYVHTPAFTRFDTVYLGH